MPAPPRSFPPSTTVPSRWLSWPALLLVLALPLALFVPGLGSSGFAHSEAFRAQPAWEMLSNHDWLVVRLFDQPYLRKPPGMIWAIAASSHLFGQTEFAARLVSALAMTASAALCWWFARRWFGGVPAIVAGLGMTLLPVLTWYPPVSRSAEIEALHNMFVLAAILVALDALLGTLRAGGSATPHASSRLASTARALALGVAFAGALLTKGPAGLPALLGVLLVAGAVRRAMRLPGTARAWTSIACGLALGLIAFAAWWLATAQALANLGEPVVTQTPSEFLFEPQRLLGIITLPIVALVAMLPLSPLLQHLPWKSIAAPSAHPTTQRFARAIAAALAAGLVISMLVGISNVRYVQPVLMLAPLCAAGAVWWMGARPSATDATRRALARWLAGGAVVLALAVAIIAWRGEVRRTTRTSGEPAGVALGEALVRDMRTRGVTQAHLWGDQMIDTRPEVLIAVTRVVRDAGCTLTPRWRPLTLEPTNAEGVVTPPLPEVGSFVIVRLDMERRPSEPPAEWGIYQSTGVMAHLEPVFDGKVHIFPFRVFRRVR